MNERQAGLSHLKVLKRQYEVAGENEKKSRGKLVRSKLDGAQGTAPCSSSATAEVLGYKTNVGTILSLITISGI